MRDTGVWQKTVGSSNKSYLLKREYAPGLNLAFLLKKLPSSTQLMNLAASLWISFKRSSYAWKIQRICTYGATSIPDMLISSTSSSRNAREMDARVKQRFLSILKKSTLWCFQTKSILTLMALMKTAQCPKAILPGYLSANKFDRLSLSKCIRVNWICKTSS